MSATDAFAAARRAGAAASRRFSVACRAGRDTPERAAEYREARERLLLALADVDAADPMNPKNLARHP